MMEHWKNGVLEHWSDGVLGRRNDGMLEEWNDGGKEIPPGLPLRQAQDDSLYKREEIGEKDGTNVEARRNGAEGKRRKISALDSAHGHR